MLWFSAWIRSAEWRWLTCSTESEHVRVFSPMWILQCSVHDSRFGGSQILRLAEKEATNSWSETMPVKECYDSWCLLRARRKWYYAVGRYSCVLTCQVRIVCTCRCAGMCLSISLQHSPMTFTRLCRGKYLWGMPLVEPCAHRNPSADHSSAMYEGPSWSCGSQVDGLFDFNIPR